MSEISDPFMLSSTTMPDLGLPAGLPPSLAAEIEAARAYRERSKATNTLRAYESDWRQFEEWCFSHQLDHLPAAPEVVATWLATLAQRGRADSTVTRHLAAIGWRHHQAGYAAPTARDDHRLIKDVLAGIRREQRARPTRKKAAITAKDLENMIKCAQGQGTRAIRDRAVLSMGMAAALRRSELVALELSDVDMVDQGFKLTIRHSKTDQEGQGAVVPVLSGTKIKPLFHLNAWLQVRGGQAGPLFFGLSPQGVLSDQPMTDRSVARLVKKYAALVNLDPETVAAHSLRAGFLTEASNAKASIAKMQQVSRQKSVDVLMGYVRSAELFDDHAGKGFL